MKPASILLSATFAAALGGAALAAEPAPVAPLGRLAGHTLSAVLYVPTPPGSHRGNLARLMVQAYLGPGGRALVRAWDEARDAYTPVVERPWSLERSTLCVGLPSGDPPRICADVYLWGPRIAGMGTQPYVQLDGDLQPGNILGRP